MNRTVLLTGAIVCAGLLTLAILVTPRASAQNLPDSRSITVTLTEGTNMAATVSPDGETLVLALQGSLWALPVQGGEAQRITGPGVEAYRPHWSPDGDRIAFQRYEGHYFQIWTIAPDGSEARAVTAGPADHREPFWSPDGERIAFSSDRSGEGSYDIWSVAPASGEYHRWSDTENEAHSPAWSPDGTRIAHVEGNRVQAVNADGDTETLASVEGDAVHAPAWTPDGENVVFQNAERQLTIAGEALTQDEDVFPFPASWLPDGRLLYTADGRIRVRDVSGGGAESIGFRATLTVDRPLVTPKRHDFDDAAPRPVRGIYSPVLSPDGNRIAFTALNDLWVMEIGDSPVQLTDDTYIEGSVSWGRDGERILFSSDRHGNGRPELYSADPDSGEIVRLSEIPDSRMVFPVIGPDGERFAYIDATDQSLHVYDIATGESRHVADQVAGSNIGRPTWSPDGQTIVLADIRPFNTRFREGRNLIRAIDVGSGDWQFHEPAPLPDQLSDRFEAGPVWSPDGQWMAFVMRSTLHVMPVAADGTPRGPARQLTDHAADMPSWGGDSETLLYLSNGRLRTVQRNGADGREIPFDLEWSRNVATGTTHIHAGGLWDGIEPALQQDMVIRLEGARITGVTPAGEDPAATAQAEGARFIDATDLTVMPGLWDAHIHPRVLDITGPWWAVQPAWGVTTALSNGGSTYHTMLVHESIEAGRWIGPRLLTSPLFDGQRPYYGHHRSVHDEQALTLELEKARALDMDFLKAYVRAPLSYMERVAGVAQEMGVPSGSHFLSPGIQAGLGGTTHLSASQRVGYSLAETAAGNSYQDVMALYTQGRFALSSHHTRFQNLLGATPEIGDDPRFTVLMPDNYHEQLREQLSAPPTEVQRQAALDNVATPAAIHEGGGLVTIGSDTPLAWPALGLHAQLRAYAMAVGSHEALQAVTINAARYAHAADELGTLEVGKIADLVFVRGNPLEDVANAANVERVMINGEPMSVEAMLRPYR